MPRALTSGMQTAVAAESSAAVHLFEFAFSGGTERFCSAAEAIAWDGQTWLGIGGVMTFSSLSESGDLSSSGVEFTLSGVDVAVLATILQEQRIGRLCRMWRAHVTPATGQIVADPVLLFEGRMNGDWEIREQPPVPGRSGTITIRGRCSSELAELDQRRGIQANVAAHQAYYPGDLFFSAVGHLAYENIIWRR